MPRIFVVTTVHNDVEHTKKMLMSVLNQKLKPEKIIIVDDGSTDETEDFIKKNKQVIYLKGNGNLWWTGGINLAIKKALSISQKGDYILTINNDCIVKKDYLDGLLKLSTGRGRAIVGSTEYDISDKNTILNCAILTDWKKGMFKKYIPKKIIDNSEYIDNTDTLQTKGTLIPIEVFKKIGLLDQKHFPHYGSDFEFFIRAKKSGFKLIVSTKFSVYCDKKRTGISIGEKGKKINSIFKLAFSRKSQVNIIDHINLIRFCCPGNLKIKNYLILLRKIINFSLSLTISR